MFGSQIKNDTSVVFKNNQVFTLKSILLKESFLVALIIIENKKSFVQYFGSDLAFFTRLMNQILLSLQCQMSPFQGAFEPPCMKFY